MPVDYAAQNFLALSVTARLVLSELLVVFALVFPLALGTASIRVGRRSLKSNAIHEYERAQAMAARLGEAAAWVVAFFGIVVIWAMR